ncbi:A/G-specific adenine glycosylase [Pontivivens insulae]|uniref:Adenine DNA glycosylase n=1 Tax=Pontivivens insulae TaxID=1639689 RepID=A0A2R8A8E9_9RHOB|nr:A/G-specific adenine glycosylase [Pontivivens insulae]RED18606.1 A/G-specific DNA-adenine glycosylase [Pontivivens insulae]SPF28504.1 Adenine DNA glycosylase [Pontivivens insulae]
MDATTLLDWYDIHHRDMPWRVPPAARKAGEVPNPYHVWLSEVMLQQTTVAAVRAYHTKFTALWPTVEDLAAADDADVMAAWAGLGYYARARNLLKCAREVTARGGFPNTEAELLTLPGIGPYTAAAVASIAFDRKATVLDGNVERVMARLHAIEEPLPDSKETLRTLAAERTPDARPGDYAQAVMDLGATICTPKSPACGICPWMKGCAGRIAGIAAELPRKRPKKAKPTRLGHVYIARRPDGATLMETRPPKGLLGGMLALPTSEWTDAPSPAPPLEAGWREIGEVRHTFTHFHLILTVWTAETLAAETRGHWVDQADPGDLPTVFAKALRLAL